MKFSLNLILAVVVITGQAVHDLYCQDRNPHSTLITGEVTDKKTGKPLPGANVYIVNTLLGAAADETGFYRIFRIPEGKITVIASYVGYKIQKVELNITGEFNYIDFELEQNVEVLEEIVVEAMSRKKWRNYLKRFEREFLGNTNNARKCKILNPEVMSFKDLGNDDFSASASEMLLVENKALGYKINLVLDHFSIVNDIYNIIVHPVFQELTPKNLREKRNWEKERLRAFNGSLKHLFTSIANGIYETEGFIIQKGQQEESDREFSVAASNLYIDSLLYRGDTDFEKVLFSQADILMTYTKETEESSRYTVRTGFQKTVLKFRDNRTRFYLDGFFPDQHFPISVFGYLARERVAELLPREYNPLYDRYRK